MQDDSPLHRIHRALDGLDCLISVDSKQQMPPGFKMTDIEQNCVNFVWHDQKFAWKDPDFGRLPLSLESNGGVANALLNIERYDLGLDYYLRYESLIRAVTPDQVRAAAKAVIHDDVAVTGVLMPGPTS